VVVVIPVEATEQAAADILRLGTEAEVLQPPGLRRHIAELANALSRVCRDGTWS
jgi:hypothetical protein